MRHKSLQFVLSFCALTLTACGSSNRSEGPTVLAMDGDEFTQLNVPANGRLQIADLDDDRRVEFRIAGDLDCAGEVEIAEAVDEVRIVVGGDLSMTCPIRQAGVEVELPEELPDIEPVPLTVMHLLVDGEINIGDGFDPFFGGTLLLTDDSTDQRTPETIIAALIQDDGTSPTIGFGLEPPPEESDQAGQSPAAEKKQAADGRLHTFSGEWGAAEFVEGLKNSGGVLQNQTGLYIGLAGDVTFGSNYNGPTRSALPPLIEQRAFPGTPLEVRGMQGADTPDFVLVTTGSLRVTAQSNIHLGVAGPGQDAAAFGGRPASAIGGKGGGLGRVRLSASRGFEFDLGRGAIEFAAVSGPGGNADATGASASPVDCGDLPGGEANAISGSGGDLILEMIVRGVGAELVRVGSLLSAEPGIALADGGQGQPGCDTPGGHGAKGGDATIISGRSGDVDVQLSAAAGFPPPDLDDASRFDSAAVNWSFHGVRGGDGGNGGRSPGNCPDMPLGGNGGAGGSVSIGGGSRGTVGSRQPPPDNDWRIREDRIVIGRPGNCGLDGGLGAMPGGFVMRDSYQVFHLDEERYIPTPSVPPSTPDCPCPTPTGTIVQPPPTEEPTPTPVITGEPTPTSTPTPTPTPTPEPTGVAACAGEYLCTGCRFPEDPPDEIRLSPVPGEPDFLFIEDLDSNDSPLLFGEDTPPGRYRSERNDLRFFGSPTHFAEVELQKDDSGQPTGMQWFVQTNDGTGSCTMSCSFVGP